MSNNLHEMLKGTGMYLIGVVTDHNTYGDDKRSVDLLLNGLKAQVSASLPEKVGFDFFPIGEKVNLQVTYSEWKGRTYFKILKIMKEAVSKDASTASTGK
jgi:hypothetical protein